MDVKFKEMDDKLDNKFKDMDGRFDNKFKEMEINNNAEFRSINNKPDGLAIRQDTTYGRFENQFKGMGGSTGSPEAYNPIANKFNKYPSESRLEDLVSLNQFQSFTSQRLNSYLKFYGLPTHGDSNARKERLTTFIGFYSKVDVAVTTENKIGELL